MHPQLQSIVMEFEGAREQLRALVQGVPEHLWTERPDPGRWSMSECVAHLNLTATAYLPLLHNGLAQARTLGDRASSRYRLGPIGWVLWKTMLPPVRHRVKTASPFVPAAAVPPGQLAAEFERLQDEQLACVRESDGLPVDRVTLSSPFNPKMKYSLYAALAILPRHQLRHLWQAEQAWRSVRRRGATSR